MTIETPDWVKDAVFYQIFPDRFAMSERVPKPPHLQPWESEPTYHGFMGGDLLGIVERLDYLVKLGINAIYFNPIFASGSNHRYHTFDYFQVDPLLGGNAAFAELLDAAHARGIRVVLDGVFNHASRGFFQFHHLLECGPESPYKDWFHITGWPVTAYGDGSPNYHAWWGMAALPKFNTETPAVREFLWRVAEFWLQQGIDGWRLDVPNEIDDDEFWREFRRRCRAINPDCYIVGELWHDAQRWLAGDQFDAQMNYSFARAALGFFVGDHIDQAEVSRTGYGHIRPLDGNNFLGELTRFNNKLYVQEIVLAQMNMLGSHDTPRLMTLANGDRTAVRLMYLCQMTMPGAPNIYYGDEIGLLGRHDPECRKAFPWDDAKWDKALLNELRRYIELRHTCSALRRGEFVPLFSDHDVAIYARQDETETVITAFNKAPHSRTVQFDWPQGSAMTVQQAIGQATPLAAGEAVNLPARSGCVWIAES